VRQSRAGAQSGGKPAGTAAHAGLGIVLGGAIVTYVSWR
jgi:hypothetical protein